jgi:hypothetical protein
MPGEQYLTFSHKTKPNFNRIIAIVGPTKQAPEKKISNFLEGAPNRLSPESGAVRKTVGGRPDFGI